MEQDKCFNLPPEMRNLTIGKPVYQWDYILGKPIKYTIKGRTESENNSFISISYNIEEEKTNKLSEATVFYSSLDEMYEDMLPKIKEKVSKYKKCYKLYYTSYKNLIKYYNKEKYKEREEKIKNLIKGN